VAVLVAFVNTTSSLRSWASLFLSFVTSRPCVLK